MRLEKGIFVFILSFLIPSFLFSNSAFSQSSLTRSIRIIPYYGAEFYQIIEQDQKNHPLDVSEDLAGHLNRILNNYHISQEGRFDEILDYCDLKNDQGCYSHHIFNYKAARKIILTQLHMFQGQQGPSIKDVYCQKELSAKDFYPSRRYDPDASDMMPDHTVINIEHTWPQKHFNRTGRYSRLMQKTDLHHLFPTLSKINGMRGHLPFAEVTIPKGKQLCHDSVLGSLNPADQEIYFQPPISHRGNVARSLFYFAIKYEMKISPVEERALRKWHREDPVDRDEMERNEKIFQLQGTRNPFIDFPQLAENITDF